MREVRMRIEMVRYIFEEQIKDKREDREIQERIREEISENDGNAGESECDRRGKREMKRDKMKIVDE